MAMANTLFDIGKTLRKIMHQTTWSAVVINWMKTWTETICWELRNWEFKSKKAIEKIPGYMYKIYYSANWEISGLKPRIVYKILEVKSERIK